MGRRTLSDPLMRTRVYEVSKVLAEYAIEVRVAENQYVIEAFAPHRTNEAFTDSIHEWSSHRSADDLGTAGFRDGVEFWTELVVVVADQEPRPLAPWRGASRSC